MLVEILLELLVGVVDVELFESVDLTNDWREVEAKAESECVCLCVYKLSFRSKYLMKPPELRLRLTSKFSNPKMSRMPIDLKLSLPLIFWFIFTMIQEKHWE